MKRTEKIVLALAAVAFLWSMSSTGSPQSSGSSFRLPAKIVGGSHASIAKKLREAASARGVGTYNGAQVPRLTNHEALAVIRAWRDVDKDGWLTGAKLEERLGADKAALMPLADAHELWLGIDTIARDVDASTPTSDSVDIYQINLDPSADIWPVWKSK